PQVVEAEAELLVLGADQPLRLRPPADGQVLDQLAPVGDRGAVDGAGTGHGAGSRGEMGRIWRRDGVGQARLRHYPALSPAAGARPARDRPQGRAWNAPLRDSARD